MTRLSPSQTVVIRVALTLAVATTALPRLALADAKTSAKTHLAAGSQAAHALRWDEALVEYEAALAASPSAEALLGVAEAQDALRQDVQAYAAFHDLLARYGSRLPHAAAATASARMASLARVTGLVTITMNVAGAAVTIDGAPAGDSPLALPVRLSSGLHRIRATKLGYADAEAIPTVVGGQPLPVTLALTEVTHTGHLVVRAAETGAATLLVDGREVGPLPWEGDLDAGPHDVFVRSGPRASSHQTVEIVRGQALDLRIQMTSIQTSVSIATADRHGLIAIDGASLGEGSFDGTLQVGEHRLRITRAGYETVERHVSLHEGESYRETFILTPVGARDVTEPTQRTEGVIGGLMLAGAFQANGLNGDFSEPCSFASSPSPSNCSASSPVGGAVMGYVGYAASPVGVDVLFGGQLDRAKVGLTVQGSPQASESFTTPRIGGFMAPRARVAGDLGSFRFTAAAGVGIAVRQVSLSSHGLSAITGNDPSSLYVAPAITLEGAVHVRVSAKVRLGAGVVYWAESAGNGVSLQSGSYLEKPAVVLSAVQAMVLPFVGLEVGP